MTLYRFEAKVDGSVPLSGQTTAPNEDLAREDVKDSIAQEFQVPPDLVHDIELTEQ